MATSQTTTNKGGKGGGGGEVDHTTGHFELIGGVWADGDPTSTPAVVDPKLPFLIDLRGFPTGSYKAILNAFAAWEREIAGDLFDETGTSFANANVVFGDGVNT